MPSQGGQTLLQRVKGDLSTWIPPDLVDALLDSYAELKENDFLGKHGPAELNGGKFVEACVRVLDNLANGTYVPLGTQQRDVKGKLATFANNSALSDSVRFHIPEACTLIYDIRNRRGVGHLGGDVNPNLSDSRVITAVADWVIAELVRLHYACSLSAAQAIVDGIVQRRTPLVWDGESVRRVLKPSMRTQDQVLVLLANETSLRASQADLCNWVGYSRRDNFRYRVLQPLHRARLIELGSDGVCTLLPTGLRYVEEHFSAWNA